MDFVDDLPASQERDKHWSTGDNNRPVERQVRPVERTWRNCGYNKAGMLFL